MAKWSDLQEKARQLINEGMTLIKTGAHEAEFLAGSTASAAKLHVDAGRRRLELYRTLHDLGEELLAAIRANSSATAVAVSPTMRTLFDRAQELERDVAEDVDLLERFSVTRGEKPPAPKRRPLPPRPKRPKPAAAHPKPAPKKRRPAARRRKARPR